MLVHGQQEPWRPRIKAFENGISFASPKQKLFTGRLGDPKLKNVLQVARTTADFDFRPLGIRRRSTLELESLIIRPGHPSELQLPLRQGQHPAEQRATIPTAWPASSRSIPNHRCNRAKFHQVARILQQRCRYSIDERLWDSISPAHSAHTAIRTINGESRSPLRVNHPQFSLFTKTRWITVPSAESIHSSATLRQHLQAKRASLVNTTTGASLPSRRCGLHTGTVSSYTSKTVEQSAIGRTSIRLRRPNEVRL
ncbi:hypothetical protein CRG98_002934 [Punica granatum]|uniref:Uncharacterized protein n=1 Tax=Punica granatum TaxID=22663 RepID=A0A2I0L7D4_PUNGR|nr:hypothetical protein CRG98_002934 [Punica granatum]